MYLQCLAGDCPRQWLQWLPWAEFCYNTTFQASIPTLPFKVVYGREPPAVRYYVPGEAQSPVINQQLVDRDEFLLEIREVGTSSNVPQVVL
jgi:hypothetical protein